MVKTAKKTTIFILLLLAMTACDTVLGPPGSESDFPAPPPGSPGFLDRLIEGQPNLNVIHLRGGYYVWKTGNSWHVRISRIEGPPTPYSREPFFTGGIFLDNGVILDFSRIKTKPFDDVRHSMKDISFRIEPGNNIEGFDFKVKPTGFRYCITLDLRVNDGMTPKYVYLGRSMYIPDTLPITVCFYE